MREKCVEGYLGSRMHKLGLECIKFIPDNMVGMPDRVVLLPDGKVVWVEVKTKTGSVSDVQKYRHRMLESIGQRVEVVWSYEDVDRLADSLSSELQKSV